MSSVAKIRGLTARDIQAKKGGDKIVCVTAYDVLFAKLVDEAGVDLILVGDSAGNVVAGYDSTLPVTLDQMVYHGAAVRRGTSRACVIVDMPFMTYHTDAPTAVANCGRVMQLTGAAGVKMEGGSVRLASFIAEVVDSGIPVMGHLGYTPQSVNVLGGHRVQGKDDLAVQRMVDEAKRLEQAGVFSIVLELVPTDAARHITDSIGIPTIGIGAGAECDGQVLVLPDLLGINDSFKPKFLKRYANLADTIRTAVRTYGDEVRTGTYPDETHSF